MTEAKDKKILSLKQLKWYYLNTEARKIHKEHIESVLNQYNLSFQRIEGPVHPNRYTSGAIGMAIIVETHLKTEPFQPFIILEDDVSWYSSDPNFTIEIPEDTDAVHIGISNAFCLPHIRECLGHPLKKRHPKFNHLFRIYNMLSLHGIVILTEKYAKAFQAKMFEAAVAGYCWDTYSVTLQVPFNIYALEKPLVFQDSTYNGQEKDTKINWCNDNDTIDDNFNPNRYYRFY